MIKKYLFPAFLSLIAAIAMTACSDEAEQAAQEGTLHVVLADVSADVATRSTPAELGRPAAERFSIRITNADGREVYRKPYSTADIPLAYGTYTVEATCGDNPTIGYDAPYYTGSARTTVEDGQTARAEIRCTVANALVSARFGRDEAERERFEKFYSNYALQVWNGAKAADIPGNRSARSAYFPAGSSVSLVFTATIRANGRTVSLPLDPSGTGFPTVFRAADHAIVTLSLPDPECVTAVDISKVEVVEATLGETIPLAWLPTPVATPAHVRDAEGRLEGTDIAFNNAYPGMTWRAVLTDPSGNTLRSVEGTGALASRAADNAAEWPYIPAGTYTATYYVLLNGAMQQTKTASITVPAPQITVNAEVYSSYTKYQAGDVDGANACDAFTAYAPTATLNIAPALLTNERYGFSFSATIGDNVLSGTREGSTFRYADATELTPSLTPYGFTATAHFDGITATVTKQFRITGLPAVYNPPTDEHWDHYTPGFGGVWGAWESDHVRIGQNTVKNPGYITCDRFGIPAGTRVKAAYKTNVHTGTVGSTLTLSLGNDTYFTREVAGMWKDGNDESEATFTVSADATQAKANNSYGSGQTCAHIYYLNYYYGK